MSTCELDRFVIQTPYIKVLKSCSAPFVDRAGIDDDGPRTSTDGRTDERTDRQTERTNERTWAHRWINANSLFQVCVLGPCSGCQSYRRGPYPYADSSSRARARLLVSVDIFLTLFPGSVEIFLFCRHVMRKARYIVQGRIFTRRRKNTFHWNWLYIYVCIKLPLAYVRVLSSTKFIFTKNKKREEDKVKTNNILRGRTLLTEIPVFHCKTFSMSNYSRHDCSIKAHTPNKT